MARASASRSSGWLWLVLAACGAPLSCSETGATSNAGGSAGTPSSAGSAGGAGHAAAGAAGSSGAAGAQGGTSAGGGTGGSAGASIAGSSGAGSGGASSGTAGASGTSASGGVAGVAGSAGASGNTTSGGTAGGGESGDAGSAGAAGSENGGEAGGSGSDYRPCPTDGSPCKILPFGDSITDGFGTGGAYRVELFRLAHQAGKNITFVGSGSNGPPMVDGVAFPPNHEGHSGFTIDPTPSRSGISPLVSTVMPQFTPHVITLMIGTNDCIDSYELANAPARLGALLDSIYERLPDVLIVVGQPIPSQDDALNTRIQTYNASIPAVVQARADAGRHIRLTDLYAPFAAVSDYKTSLLKDTWHPNEAGHAILGERWFAALEDVL